MTIYEFVVSFIGQVPEQFTFIYSILTLIISILLVGTFTSIILFFKKILDRMW